MVLSYIRIESDTTDYVIKKHNLDDIIKQTIKKFANEFIHKKISLDFTPTNTIVLTDEKWFSIVLEQILSNSLKYTKKGKVSIYLNDKGALVIEDTGIGIKKEDLPRICEKGFTGFNGRDDKKATGLGLYLCKRILANFSHSINVNSEAGKGTEVMICFDMINLKTE